MTQTASRPAPSSRALGLYLHTVVGVGALVLAYATFQALRTPRPLAWLALGLAATLLGAFRLRFASISANISIDDTFLITTALMFGPAPATLAIGAGALILCVRRRRPIRQITFNTAALAVSMWAASWTFFALGRVEPLAFSHAPVTPLVLPLLALAVVYFLLNSGLTAVAVALDSRQPPIVVWIQHFRWLGVGYLGAASVAFCLILLLQQRSMAAAAMVLPLLAVFHLTLRATFGRLEDARRHLGDMDRLYLSTVETLAMAIDAKDDVTHSHVRRVQAYAVGLARALGVTDEPTLKAIEAAALLHDTGKLAVPEHILNKPGKLTTSEFERMKLHVDVGADILSLVEFPYPVVPIVRAHHENWDGTGYPRGVSGAGIPIGARILSVVDCFDALTSDRPYRRRMTDAAALEILLERRGRMYDPIVVDTFIRVCRDINVAGADMTEHREVLQRIAQSYTEAPSTDRHDAIADGAAPTSLLAFVSLSRVASGDARVADVLALSSRLIGDVVPGATGAWFLPEPNTDRVVAADAFGPAAQAVRGAAVVIGDRLTGWVAANRQPIINSPANLDLGPRIEAVEPALRTCLSVPLLKGDALVAVLTLYSPETNAFDEATGRLIQMVAPHLAAAIQSATAAASTAGEPKAAPDKTGGSIRLVAMR